MNTSCPYVCNNKNSFGNCMSTACINPKYNTNGTYIQITCQRCKNTWFEKLNGERIAATCKSCGNTVYYNKQIKSKKQQVMDVLSGNHGMQITNKTNGESVTTEDIIDLLTEPLPRIMAVEEIKSSNTPLDAFIERTDWDPDGSELYAITFEKIKERTANTSRDREVFDFDDYNMLKHGWRVWTSRPSDLQRKMTQWN